MITFKEGQILALLGRWLGDRGGVCSNSFDHIERMRALWMFNRAILIASVTVATMGVICFQCLLWCGIYAR